MTTWHVDDSALTRWMAGTETAARAASTEQHLLACVGCRDRVASAVRSQPAADLPELDAVWAKVRDAVELPRPAAFERVLRRVGVPASDARLVAVARAFRTPWLTGVLMVLAFVVAAAEFGGGRGQVIFLMIAPLLPCVAVAFSYDPSVEPAVETELATPYPALRLVLLRTIAVLGVGLPVAVAISPFLPGDTSYVWLLPAAGFVAAVLAASTWVNPLNAAAGISAIWFLILLGTALDGSVVAILRPAFLASYLALAAASIALLLVRRSHLRDPRNRGSWS